jgi:hypothetical protein
MQYLWWRTQSVLNLVNSGNGWAGCGPVDVLCLKDVYRTVTNVLHIHRKKTALISEVFIGFTLQNIS